MTREQEKKLIAIYDEWQKEKPHEGKHGEQKTTRILFAKYYAERLALLGVSNWVAYDWNDIDSRPPKYGKYFVHRKDGKVHWETWNGSGWAYNEKVITHWQEVKPPCC